MLTTTNAERSVVHNYPLEAVLSTLHSSGLILFPTDTLWSIGSDAIDPVAVHRLLRLYRRVTQPQPLEVLVNSIDMLKNHLPDLHPRIETLLAYHRQPLSVVADRVHGLPAPLSYPATMPAFRLVRDHYSLSLIHQLGRPLLSMFASFDGSSLPAHFGAITSDVLTSVDQVVGLQTPESRSTRPSVMVRITPDDHLEFLRE